MPGTALVDQARLKFTEISLCAEKKTLFVVNYFMCIGVRVSDPLELELQTIVGAAD